MNITGKIQIESPSEDVIDMDQHFFPNPWDKAHWNNLDLKLNQLFTWRNDSKLIGLALFGIVPGDDVAHLYKIVISPKYRGQGVAAEFWLEITHKLLTIGIKSIYLEVESDNSRAIKFYEKLGFVILRKAKNFYSNGADALIMSITL